jgi:hypothetical protein
MMTRHISFKKLAAGLLALSATVSSAVAGDQAKAIVNALDPKSMNELFEVSRRQPDAALTNIAPVSANKFRFLFIWPASNPMMTYDRVGRSFAERLTVFADQFKLLATGFCLPSRTMYFGTAPYGEQEVNVAYRDIEVRYEVGGRSSCPGRFISMTELGETRGPARASGGYGAAFPTNPYSPPQQQLTPEESLKPLLNPKPAGN